MKLKIAMFALMALCSVCAVAEEDGVKVGFWFDAPAGISKETVKGVSFGIPVCSMNRIRGAELSLIGSATNYVRGFQYAWIGFNRAKTLRGCQLAFVNLIEEREDKGGVQVGFYNQCARRGIQIGFINNNRNNAKFQFGLVNINENGWLPVMIFVNFGKSFK